MRTRTAGVSASLLVFACVLVGSSPAAAQPSPEVTAADLSLTRDDILTRGRSWLDERVPYSQTSFHTNQFGRYRQDCSGFVSMAWGLSTSHWTGNIMEVATRIDKANLLPGDALWVHTSSHQHMALFIRWGDVARTRAVVWEEARSGTVASENTWTAARTAGFTAIRYRNVIEGDVRTCAAVNLNRTSYPEVGAGAAGEVVTVAQCLLTSAGFATGPDGPSGTFDATTASAARQYQASVGLPATGSVDAHTWTALLARGTTPLLRNGSSGDAVLRLQRALNAATTSGLTVDGQFGTNTTAAVKLYQTAVGLTSDGVVGPNTWSALQKGRS